MAKQDKEKNLDEREAQPLILSCSGQKTEFSPTHPHLALSKVQKPAVTSLVCYSVEKDKISRGSLSELFLAPL